jgi:hypothetical protein
MVFLANYSLGQLRRVGMLRLVTGTREEEAIESRGAAQAEAWHRTAE